MFRGRFIGVLVIGLLLLGLIGGLFGLGGRSSYQEGWSDGYVAGLAADGGEAAVPPVLPYRGHAGPGWGFFGFLGGLLQFFFFFLLLGLIFKLVGFFFWRRGWRGHGRGHGHGHGRGYGRGPGPWGWPKAPWDNDLDEEPVMKA